MMDQRWSPTVNEREFIEQAFESDLRVDGRGPFEFRDLKISFGREDGSAEVELGETRVMGYVTAQLVQQYKERPNEGTLAIFAEFSPMADPAYEPRESRAVDLESLCVVAGKHVWSVRVDLHVLDNGGNLIDAANIAALAALSTFRRPECTVGGDDGQQLTIHDPDVREPLPLTIHHLPIAVTFAYFGDGNIMVVDPTFKEEAIMGGRMTVTVNSDADICSIQKAGGEGVMPSVVVQCLRIALLKAADITNEIKIKTPNDAKQLSEGDDSQQNVKWIPSLSGDQTVKRKQTSIFLGGPSNF